MKTSFFNTCKTTLNVHVKYAFVMSNKILLANNEIIKNKKNR